MLKSEDLQLIIIDAKGLILGRMASLVAKRLIDGEKVIILNSEEAVISGKRLSILKKEVEFLQVGHHRKGPLHRRRPDKIVKKVIRGMLPYRKAKGRKALKNLKVLIGEPEKFKNKKREKIQGKNFDKLKCPYITIADLSIEIG